MSSRIERMSLAPFAQRSATFSVLVLTADLIVYALMVYGAIAAEALWLKLLFSFGAGTMIALSAIIGHDAGHQSFSSSKGLNRLCGTLAFLPALHPFCLWEHHHNRVHHRYTAQLGVDNAFPPMTVDDWREATVCERAHYRFMRSLWGQPFFYLIDIWVLDMFLPFLRNEPKMNGRTWFDLILVYVYLAAFLAGTIYLAYAIAGDGSWWNAAFNAVVFAWAIPFLIWNVFISFLSIVQHTGPEVRWTVPNGQPSNVDQMLAGTVHIVFPEWLDRLMHRIMQHQAHHVHVGIPLQELRRAQAAVAEANDGKLVQVWTPLYHWRLTRTCKLYDHRRNRWVGFDAAAEAPESVKDIAA